jgi:CheY-like chemotaxis protein
LVDDEAPLLNALVRRIARLRDSWTIVTATGGQEALAILESQAVDIVVTDMRMPGMHGVTLLEHARALHPDSVRVVLSGEVEPEKAAASLAVAHLHLSKPCPAVDLVEAIERTRANLAPRVAEGAVACH